jgi:hypothetical protein
VTERASSKLINDFFTIKKAMSNMVHALYDLYDIDWVFKKYAGYPTTWFFNSSIFFNFINGYDTMVENLIKAVKIESDMIEPLFVWNIKVGE